MSIPEPKTIAFVLYEGLTAFDLAGPLQVLTSFCQFAPHYQTQVVAERLDPFTSDNGLKLIPNRTFDQAPHPFAIFLPGGNDPTLRAMLNPAIRRYVRGAAETAEVIASACTGALILAGVGLLDDKSATTHWAFARTLNSLGARYRRARWVEDGKFLTTAGVSAGIDGALYLVAKLTDRETARQVQLDLQYDPQPPFGAVDYNRLDLISRLYRLYYDIRGPLAANQAKKMTRLGA